MNQQNSTLITAFRAAFPHTIPILAGFLLLGAAYGILMSANGYGVIWSVLMSVCAFCGSMQYVAITLLTGPFEPLQAFFLSIMVNARHVFYGISMLGKYRGMGKIKPFLIFMLCDETFSIASTIKPPANTESKSFYLAVSLLNYFYWVLGTFIGGVMGSVLSFNTKGLDFALTALFVVLFIEQLKSKNSIISGIIGALAAIISLLIFGADNLVIPAMILILIGLIAGRNKICR